jgi:hypothetical protein
MPFAMVSTWRSLLLIALLGLMFSASALSQPSGIVNGEFDSDLGGWSLSGPPFPGWSMLDHQGNAASGSAELLNDSGQVNVRLYPLHQCIALALPGSYRLEARGYLPAGHDSGRLVVSYGGRVNPDCSGGGNPVGGFFVQSNGSWQQQSANVIFIEPFLYLDLSLGIEKDAGNGALIGNFDGIRLIYREIVFADGFDAT